MSDQPGRLSEVFWSCEFRFCSGGGDQANGSVVDYTVGGSPPEKGYDANDTPTRKQYHATALDNSIDEFYDSLDPAATTTFEHDAAGNLTDNGMRKYIYDAWNRLVEVTKLDGEPTARYRYDALGRRIRKRVFSSGDDLNTVRYGQMLWMAA